MRRRACLVLPFLASAAVAQNSFVVPSGFDTQSGNTSDSYLFYSSSRGNQHPIREQLVYGTADIPVAVAVITAFELRRSPGNVALPAGVASLTLDMSVGPNDADQVSGTFASNHGTQVTRVFSGNVNVPPDNSTQIPAPWTVNVMLSTPFVYIGQAGRGLVLDFQITSFAPVAGSGPWQLDAAVAPPGQRNNNGAAPINCRFTNGNYNNSISYYQPALGAIWFVAYSNILPGAPGMGAIGAQGVGGSWGGAPLPIDLGPLGAPGCSWNASVAIMVPLLADQNGNARWPDVQMPNDAGLANQSFFDQSVFVDAAANQLGLVTGWSSRWTFGPTPSPAGTRVYRLLDSAGSPTGTVQRQATIARFLY